ncbi:MAG TPA: radical SAM protein [Acidobacteriota bacterium]|nr:radical SAM protein [Acidobacteriota bacterium]
MDTIDYATYCPDFHSRVIAGRIPLTGTIEVTRRCPQSCLHCYNNLPMNDSPARVSELSFAEHCRLLDAIADAGCLWLLYTGGEVFARPDFLDIYIHAKKAGLIITLFSNGTLITPQVADCLVEWKPFSIEITIYGSTRETYERLTGTPGSYDRCLRGIDLLLERKLPLRLKTVAVSTNRHEIWHIKRFAEDLGLEFKFDSMINPRIDCSQSPLAVRLSPEEVVQLDLLDPVRVWSWRRFVERFGGPAHRPEDRDGTYHCGAGIDSFFIDPQGRMSLCSLSHASAFDLRHGSFKEAWEGIIREERQRKATRVTKCTSCEIKSMCGMCPANAELEAGDPELPVDFLCHVAHLRALALGFAVPPHGPCEYCANGTKHEALVQSLALLRERGESRVPPFTISENDGRILSMLNREGTGALGGCGSECDPTALESRSGHQRN